jgi:uncharacterized membrane protein
MKLVSGEEKLEVAISYILILGVMGSVIIETAGIVSYYQSNRNLSIVFQPGLAMRGVDFFSYAGNLIQQLFSVAWTPLQMIALGIVLLMVTPYVRVVASVIYFGFAKNTKYLFITLFVLAVLTASLLAH